MDQEKIKELKHKALDANMTLSGFLAHAGTQTTIEQAQKAELSTGGIKPQE